MCSGAVSERAAAGADRLAGRGATCLASFGLAGGLDAGLRPGDLVLATAVVTADGGDRSADAGVIRLLTEAAARLGLALRHGKIAGSDHALTTALAKQALYAASGAVAVDMESHAVAAVAARHGLPFVVVRAIADPAARALPPPALVGLGPEGETRPLAVALALLNAPYHLPALLKLAADSRHGFATLRTAARLFRPEQKAPFA